MTEKVEVICTNRHPNRPEGQHYFIPVKLVDSLTERGFVYAVGTEPPVAPHMPKAVEVIKPKPTRKPKK